MITSLAGARFDARLSAAILQEMGKMVFMATSAGITCLMRRDDTVAAGAAELATGSSRSARRSRRRGLLRVLNSSNERATFTAPGSPLTASMLRDIERGAAIEADRILGDLRRRGDANRNAGSLLNTAFRHVKAYEARLARNQAETPKAA